MLSLAFTPESLEVQRKVVMEEFKQHYLNQPYGDVSHLVASMAYKKHPYRWPTIGLKLEHIAETTMDEVKDFFFRFYAPNNAILSVTGNITFEKTVQLAEKWFGDIPRRNIDLTPIPQEPPMQRQRRMTVRRNVPSPLLYMAFPIVNRIHPDFNACDMISDILANGHSSRLYKRLVEQDKLFTSIDAYVSGRIDTGLLYIVGMPADGISMEDAEKAVWQQLDTLCHELVTDYELEKVKNKFETNLAMETTDYQHNAAEMAYFEMLGDADLINHEAENYRRVTATHLRQVCRRVLRRKNSCVLHYKCK
jgi:predicted Zn-dependent peptidase